MKKLLLLFILIPFIGLSQVQIGQTIFGEASGDNSGRDVAMSSNGNIIAVSSDENNSNRGHVRVYEKINGFWYQYGQDIDGENPGDYSGESISLSENGNILAVGEVSYNGPRGRVRIYEYSNNTWTQIGQDILAEGNNDFCGRSVSLSANGNRVAIGANGNVGNTGNLFTGHARVFEYSNNIWTQIGQDIDGEFDNDEFGSSLELSSDGSILAVGGKYNDGNGNNSGHVRVFEYSNNIWTQIGQDIDGEDEINFFGHDVALSLNGNIIAVGAPANNSNSSLFFNGHVRVFENLMGVWTQIGQDIDGENNSEQSGHSISLSADGTILVIGAPGDSFNGSNSGRVRVYKYINGNWLKVGNNIDGDQGNDNLGWSIDLSSNGNNIVIGILNGGSSSQPRGSAKVYNITVELATLEVVEDIQGNTNGINVTATQLNSITGVSGAIEGVNYTTALDNGTFVDENNPTASEIQAIIDMVNATLSVNDNNILSFKIYPNPTKTQFTIQLNNTAELENLSIYDNLGKLVLSSKETTIDSSKLASGLYVVEIQTNKGKGSKKLIIE